MFKSICLIFLVIYLNATDYQPVEGVSAETDTEVHLQHMKRIPPLKIRCKPCPLVTCDDNHMKISDKSICACPICIPKPMLVETSPCPPMKCTKIFCTLGYEKSDDSNRCSCPKCIHKADPSSESSHLPSQPSRCKCSEVCGKGTRLVTDPTHCKSPKCIKKSLHSPQSSRLHALPKICNPPAEYEVQCGRGTKLVVGSGKCKCRKCVPIDETSSEESLIPTENEEEEFVRPLPALPCKPISCPQVLCAADSKLVTDPRGCKCPTCVCNKPKVCPKIGCLGNVIHQPCGCPICVPRPNKD